MMAATCRPRKRPRLHLIGSGSPEPDSELTLARQRNDSLLKSRWESIFRKYEKDFTGIGDEIGLVSGQIEVDNGHLRSMHDERDAGTVQDASSTFDGRRMLRAMTTAPSDTSASLPDADEVLQSIETIADNALAYGLSSDDDLFDAESEDFEDGDEDELSQEYYSDRDDSPGSNTKVLDGSSAARSKTRSESIDSLFAPGPIQGETHPSSSATLEYPEPKSPNIATLPHDPVDTAVLREQVRQILEEEKQHERVQKEARVDPAWRIPVRIPSPALLSSVPSSMVPVGSTDRSHSDVQDQSESHIDLPLVDLPLESGSSLWKPASRHRRSRREVVAERNLKRIRDESEDPLQEGFSDDVERQSRHPSGDPTTPRPMQISPRKEVADSGESATPSRTQQHAHQSRRVFVNIPQLSSAVSQSNGIRSPDAAESEATMQIENAPQPTNRHSKVAALRLRRREVREDDEPAMHNVGSSKYERSDGDQLVENKDEEVEQFDETVVGGSGSSACKSIKERQKVASKSVRASKKETADETSQHPCDPPTTRSAKAISKLASAVRKTAQGKSARNFATDEHGGQSPDGEPGERSGEQQNTTEQDNEVLLLRNAEGKEVLKPLANAECFYCKVKYFDKSALGAHWDRILIHSATKAPSKDDPHNVTFIRSVRSQVKRRNRAPAAVVNDRRRINRAR